MQTIGPYRLLQALGTCQVGGVWSAVGASDQRVTMAVLSANAARDPKARTDFATVANELARSGQVPVIGGDFSAPTPWVASSAVDGSVVAQIFVAMGAVYHPLVAEPDGWQVPEQATVVLTPDQSAKTEQAEDSATADQPPTAPPGGESATDQSDSNAATQLLPIHTPSSGDAATGPDDQGRHAAEPATPDSPESPADSDQTTTVLSFGQTGATSEPSPEPVSPPAGPAQVPPAASPGWEAPPPGPVPPQPEPPSVPPQPAPAPVAAPPFSPAATSEAGYAEQVPLTPPPPPPPAPPADQGAPAFPVAPVSPPQQWGAADGSFPAAPAVPQYGQALPQVYPGQVAQGQLMPAAPPVSSPPVSPYAAWEYPPPPVSGGPGAPGGPSAPGAGRGRRTVLLVVVGVLALVLVGGAAAAGALLLRGDSDPTAQPSPTPTSEAPAPPREPGIEPPLEGAWPQDWPQFGPGDGAQRMENLPGVGFSFEIPAGWQCTDAGSTPDEAHYTCGIPGGDPQVGGDLIVRACPEPCDAERRVQMRRAEEAWGVQWIRDGGYLSWAEATADIAGEEYYRVVFVGYYRSSEEGRIDRQVVFRMTALAEDRDDLRKTANSVRSGFR